MKTLGLLRHGKSSWDDPELRDFDRPLKRRGREASVMVGEELRRRKLRFDRVLASPAARVVETIEYFEKGFGEPLRPMFREDIYAASSRGLLSIVQATADSVDRLLLVGHNPGFQDLACVLASAEDPLAAAVGEHYPTAAFALIELPVPSWAEVGPNGGRIADFLRPRELGGRKK
jgi:phosphohistidine phosphatase